MPSSTSPGTLDKEVALLTPFNSTSTSTMTSVGENGNHQTGEQLLSIATKGGN